MSETTIVTLAIIVAVVIIAYVVRDRIKTIFVPSVGRIDAHAPAAPSTTAVVERADVAGTRIGLDAEGTGSVVRDVKVHPGSSDVRIGARTRT